MYAQAIQVSDKVCVELRLQNYPFEDVMSSFDCSVSFLPALETSSANLLSQTRRLVLFCCLATVLYLSFRMIMVKIL